MAREGRRPVGPAVLAYGARVRVYLPVLDADLAQLQGGALPGPRGGHAVTAELARAWPGVQDEELDYHVLAVSADDAYDLLRASAQARRRRAVVVADVPDAAVRPGPSTPETATTVQVLADVRADQVVAVYVDQTGPADDLLPDQELLWYAPQELADLLE